MKDNFILLQINDNLERIAEALERNNEINEELRRRFGD